MRFSGASDLPSVCDTDRFDSHKKKRWFPKEPDYGVCLAVLLLGRTLGPGVDASVGCCLVWDLV